jgi:hypothetical protein
MSGTVCGAINTFPELAQILQNGMSVGGILETVEPVGGCLVRVVVSGWDGLVDDSLQDKLLSLVGQSVVICHALGKWGCGVMPEVVAP